MFKQKERISDLLMYDTNDRNLTDLQPRLFKLPVNLCPLAMPIVMCCGLISCHTSLLLKQSEVSCNTSSARSKGYCKGLSCQEDFRSGVMS